MPAPIVERLNAELRKALDHPKVRQIFADFAFEATPGTAAEFRTVSRSESARLGQGDPDVGGQA